MDKSGAVASRTFFYKIVCEIAVVMAAILGLIPTTAARIGAASAVLVSAVEAIPAVGLRIGAAIASNSVATAVARVISQIFVRLFLTPSSSCLATKHYATPALLMVALRCLRTTRSILWNLCIKLKFSQIARILRSAYSLLSRVAYSLTFVKDFAVQTPALPGRIHSCRNNRQRHAGLLVLQSKNSGAIIILLAFFAPIVFFAFKYSESLFERRQKILEMNSGYYRKYDREKVALMIAKAWNPAKTLDHQDLNSVYEDAYDSGVWCPNSTIGAAIDGIISDDLENSNADTTPDASSSNGPTDVPTTSEEKIAYTKKHVTISVEDDKIKVTCNGKSACVLPNECNLDLILAIPTAFSTEIEEIGKASANFLKDNLYYTRGVYVSIIPYSGKLSLPSSRYDDWTEAFPAFVKRSPLTLYDLYGAKSISLSSSETTATNYDSAGSSNGYSIMSRPSLFNASTASSSKYKRMNISPCTSFSLNSLGNISMTLHVNYTANPHAIMEPVSDLTDAYNKCNSLTLPSDNKNTSSFIFAALEWSNNMFQSWTADPQISAVTGGNNGILSNPSKTTPGRKKAIILLVNKPDTFTDGEMTYLGLSNDADQRENSLNIQWADLEFDKPRTCIAYGNGKFVTFISGSNVAAYSTDGIHWTTFVMTSAQNWQSVCFDAGKFILVARGTDIAARSTNGTTWTEFKLPFSGNWQSVCYGAGKFVAIADNSNKGAYSFDGISWTEFTLPFSASWQSVCYGGDKYIAIAYGSEKGAYSYNGKDWSEGTICSARWRAICYGANMFITASEHGPSGYSYDGFNWEYIGFPSSSEWKSVCYGGDFIFYSPTHSYTKLSYSITKKPQWREKKWLWSGGWNAMCYGDGKVIAVGDAVGGMCMQFIDRTNSVGNKAIKDALGDGSPSGVTTLTTQACNKLKSAYGDNVRIYLIKYRKSDGDYTYLDDCATSTGGKSYDVADSDALKTTLDTIAADLKSWAGYQDARVVN